ncbi:MAG: energy transducer TonB [Proteobacteria bacterium]|nr:energy transducer TonB [Pseudomonadota bacterium]NDC24522.1 energy transducer TonB [Pseudomonadota bacterium]NDD04441.1 energy transducer TonB [Pseudomonadota bacterium]NDG26761.1 energy transducer TonB [Pseudomonadota bacterium]
MNRVPQQVYKSIKYLAVAVILHSVLLWISVPQELLSDGLQTLTDKVIEIANFKDLDSEKKPVVQTSKLQDSQRTSETAKFSGEFENRVEQEMRSPLIGSFQEGWQRPEVEDPNSELEEGAEFREKKNIPMKNLLTFGRSPHALPEDIPLGNQTLLNTDKVRYASFINRIADEIYQPWVESAERVVHDYYSQQRRIEPNLYVTKLRITLDTDGAIKAIQVLESCGLSELDEAPKKAFWEAEPFPNPPSQLLEDDGFIRLTYEFQFEWKNSAFNIVPWKI